jgi:glycosyltransferase involved in cell wall biosynthesis
MREIPKNILFVHGSNDLYGASKVLLNVIDTLQKTGQYNLHVLLPYKGVLDEILLEKGIKVKHKNLGVLRQKYFNFCGLINRGIKIIQASVYIRKYIKAQKIDLTYTNTSVILSAGIAARLTGIKSVFHIHETPKRNGIYQKISGGIIDRISDKVITVSKVVSQHWIKHISEKKITHIYNSIELTHKLDIKKLKTTSSLNIICVGRLSPLKGHEYLMEIISKLKVFVPEIKVEIIGDIFRGYESYEVDLRDMLKELELTDIITFTGFVKDMEDKYKDADILIHPSILPDSLPTVILEAMSYGTPVIATDLGGAKELLQENINGLLIPLDDAEIAAENIRYFIKNREEQKKCILNAHENLKTNFTPEQFSERINQTVQSL